MGLQRSPTIANIKRIGNRDYEEFGGVAIMSKSVKLSNAVTYSKGRIASKDVSLETFITTDNILQNKGGISIATNLPPSEGAMPLYKPNDILIANIRPYLKKIWFSNRTGGCSADVLVLDVKKEFDPKFIFYSLFRDDFFDHVMRGSKGTKMPRGDKDQILNFLIPNLALSTQQQIASVLSAIDAKIELNNRINAELEAMAKTLYDYWFVQFEFPYSPPTEGCPQDGVGIGKPYKSSGGLMVWNEQLKRKIPEGWEVKTIGDLANVIDPHPSHRAPKEVQEGFPFAGIGDIDEFGNIDINKARVINEDFVNKQENDYEINNSSIGYGRVGTVGKVVRLRKQSFRFALSPTMAIINPIYASHFIWFAVKDKSFYKEVLKRTSGTTRPAIGIMELRKIPIVIPKNDELINNFQNTIDSGIKIIENQNRQNQQLSELRDWLLPMLMNGQVTVAEAEKAVYKEEEMMGVAAEPVEKYTPKGNEH